MQFLSEQWGAVLEVAMQESTGTGQLQAQQIAAEPSARAGLEASQCELEQSAHPWDLGAPYVGVAHRYEICHAQHGALASAYLRGWMTGSGRQGEAHCEQETELLRQTMLRQATESRAYSLVTMAARIADLQQAVRRRPQWAAFPRARASLGVS